jgi:anhydro-N-acetylmuramic acid kinase
VNGNGQFSRKTHYYFERKEKIMLIVGLMSGTSADAIDAALCEIEGVPPQLKARIVHAVTFPYPDVF